jgi:hypothetical protein
MVFTDLPCTPRRWTNAISSAAATQRDGEIRHCVNALAHKHRGGTIAFTLRRHRDHVLTDVRTDYQAAHRIPVPAAVSFVLAHIGAVATLSLHTAGSIPSRATMRW